MKRTTIGCCLGLSLMASSAFAADVESGKRLAQLWCAACHIVTGSPRNDLLADAPPEAYHSAGFMGTAVSEDRSRPISAAKADGGRVWLQR
jgi:mono/diheme cytochrome c family protein